MGGLGRNVIVPRVWHYSDETAVVLTGGVLMTARGERDAFFVLTGFALWITLRCGFPSTLCSGAYFRALPCGLED